MLYSLERIEHFFTALDKVNLLIFDECHHATGNDPYAKIMQNHYNPSSQHSPRILGLTASISGEKITADKLPKVAGQLENIFHARIETGSDRMEINRNSTSVKVHYESCTNYRKKIDRKYKIVAKIFNEIQLLYDELEDYLKTRKNNNNNNNYGIGNDFSTQNEPLNSISLQCRTLDQLKSHLDNNRHIGDDLGLYGFSLGIRALVKHLKRPNISITRDSNEKELYNKIIDRLEILVNEHLINLPDNPEILFSDKVHKVEQFIRENKSGQSIVFVERVYTAAYLSQILNEKLEDSFQVKHLAGSKAFMNGIKVSAKNQV